MTFRWTPQRKQRLVEAYHYGRITAEEIEQEHGIPQAELEDWVRRNREGGVFRLAVGLYRGKKHGALRQPR